MRLIFSVVTNPRGAGMKEFNPRMLHFAGVCAFSDANRSAAPKKIILVEGLTEVSCISIAPACVAKKGRVPLIASPQPFVISAHLIKHSTQAMTAIIRPPAEEPRPRAAPGQNGARFHASSTPLG